MALSADKDFAQFLSSLKTILKKFLVIFFVVLALFLLAAFLIALLRLSQKGFSVKVAQDAGVFAHKIIFNPWYLIQVYWDWGKSFWQDWQSEKNSVAFYLPAVFPAVLLGVISYCSFKFIKFLKNRKKIFAETLPQNLILSPQQALDNVVLGAKDEQLLFAPENSAVLLSGEALTGKTDAVVIPSVLQADAACLVFVGLQNDVIEYTGGYRASLGPIFYFNWELKDDPERKEFYPRWNPLSVKEMPHKGEKRFEYLSGLARYFVMNLDEKSQSEDAYWEKLAVRALSGMLWFFVEKVERAAANDYFLSLLLDKGHLQKEDKELLLSYYVIMSDEYAAPAIQNLESGNMNMETYLPIGSWEGVPSAWQGKELSFPMFFDWLLQCFLAVKAQDNENVDSWKVVSEYCLQEAEFFGYDEKVLDVLRQLFYLSYKQRSVIFPMILRALSVFRDSAVRERTSTSDFSMAQIRGCQDAQTGETQLTSVYAIASGKNGELINKLFVDMLAEYAAHVLVEEKMKPILWVFDNLEQQTRYRALFDLLKNKDSQLLSLIMSCSSVAELQHKYSAAELVNLINSSEYKILMGEDVVDTLLFMSGENGSNKIEKGVSFALEYRRLAKILHRSIGKILKKGQEILFAPKFYSLPYQLDCAYFSENEVFEQKATIETQYFLTDELLQRRNTQDMEVPELAEVLKNSGYQIENEEEIDLFLDDKYEESVETREQVSDKESVLVDDISTRWKNVPDTTASDWWMDESSFDFSNVQEDVNPFQKK